MEILYVCTFLKEEDYYIIDEEYSFNGNYEIYFDMETQKIQIEYIEKLPNNFYGDRISNISCLIGNNGSGKTTKIDYLINALTDKRFQENTLVICKEKNICAYTENHQDALSNQKIEVKSLEKFYQKYNLVLYSNVFNNQHYLVKRLGENFYDLSSIGLLNKINRTNNYQDSIFHFFKNEVKDQIAFCIEYSNDIKLPFKIPCFALVNLLKIDDFNYENTQYKEQIEKFLYRMNCIFMDHQKELKKLSFEYNNMFELVMVKQLITLLLVNMLYEKTDNHNDLITLFQKYDSFFDTMKIQDILTYAIITMNEIKEVISTGDSDHYKINSIIDFLVFLKTTESYEFIDLESMQSKYFFLDMRDQRSIEFINYCLNVSAIREMIQVEWKMSSGEFALFSLFSRFYSISKKLSNENKSVLILIDEIDCLLHPEWQQKIVNYLVHAMPIIIKDVSIQFLITTHSPILLSDIPRSNVTFLTKKNSNNEVDKKHKETFGANISTIYFDSFALEQGSIGDFAKAKINALIKAMVEVKTDEEGFKIVEYKSVKDIKKTLKLKSQKEIELYINLIGEPIIRNKLLNLFEKCKGNVVS